MLKLHLVDLLSICYTSNSAQRRRRASNRRKQVIKLISWVAQRPRGRSLRSTIVVAFSVGQAIREEAKTTSRFYIAQLIKVDKQTSRSRARRDEQLSTTTRQHAQMRVDFHREREQQASAEIGSHIATERIPELQVTPVIRGAGRCQM